MISGSLESGWAHKHCLDVVTGLSDKSANEVRRGWARPRQRVIWISEKRRRAAGWFTYRSQSLTSDNEAKLSRDHYGRKPQ